MFDKLTRAELKCLLGKMDQGYLRSRAAYNAIRKGSTAHDPLDAVRWIALAAEISAVDSDVANVLYR